MSQDSYSRDELRGMFIEAGFRVINVESRVKKYTYLNFSSLLSNYDNLYFYYY